MRPLYWGIAGAVLFTAAMFGPNVGDLRWRRLHHAYYGVILLGAGLLLRWPWLQWVGAGLLLDDGIQHGLQRLFHRPDWRPSLVDYVILPLVWKIPGVPWLARQLDRLAA